MHGPTHARDPAPPLHVASLGYGGLLPFIVLAVLMAVDGPRAPRWSDALVGYGAVILSFVGALHWGFAMTVPALAAAAAPDWRRRAFVWSVVPALMAWPATFLVGGLASVLLLVGFAAHLVQDIRLAGPAGLLAWYLPLRWRLTVVACACLLVDAAYWGGLF